MNKGMEALNEGSSILLINKSNNPLGHICKFGGNHKQKLHFMYFLFISCSLVSTCASYPESRHVKYILNILKANRAVAFEGLKITRPLQKKKRKRQKTNRKAEKGGPEKTRENRKAAAPCGRMSCAVSDCEWNKDSAKRQNDVTAQTSAILPVSLLSLHFWLLSSVCHSKRINPALPAE